MNPIFLDYNSTSPIRPDVLEAIMPFLKEEFGNPSSVHQWGQRARKAVEDARAQVASFIGAEDPSEIVFTSGGTEANNMAIKGALQAHKGRGRRAVSSAIEHSSVRSVMKDLSAEGLIDHVVIPVQPNGIIRPQDVEDALTPDTFLVSIMAANNEIGTIQPVRAIADICRKKGIPFHTDGVQSAGKMPIRVKEWEVDMMSLSGHKFGAPKGVGVLYIKKGARLHALIQGGRQEQNRRAGTENVMGIVGIGVAAAIERHLLKEESAHLQKLRDQFEKDILASIPSTSVNGDLQQRICNTSNICFDYTENTALLMALDLKGVACSIGSACAAGNPDPSHVLLALGLPQHKARASVRFSLGYGTTEQELRSAVAVIKEAVERLRETHPLWKKAANQ